MGELSYRRHRFPPPIIQHAMWLYLRFTLSYRDVEELLAERGLEVSYETVRRWVLKFGPGIARKLRRCRPRPSDRWHLDGPMQLINIDIIGAQPLQRLCDLLADPRWRTVAADLIVVPLESAVGRDH